MLGDDIFGEDFTAAVIAACVDAREETLKAGVSVFYRDGASGIEIMERGDGRKFEFTGHLRTRAELSASEISK